MNSCNKHYPVNTVCLFFFCCLAFVYVLPPIGVAHAKTIDEAKAAYTQGRFAEAARISESLGTSQGFALSAESLSVHANYIAKEGEKKELLERAVTLARKAVISNPNNADAHLQLARAIGRRAETVGIFEAAGEAEKIRESTETALRINPKLVAAHLSLGRWHSELVGAMGSFMARTVYGARKKDAIASFERALALAPNAKAVSLQYALGLIALEDFKYQEKARNLLMRSIGLPAKDAYERILHIEAVEALDNLNESDDDDDDY
ncbi:MAG: hypothetical protein F4X32_03785 [Candidatus Dadabacteria bacterium]|nr:hypothetical protein [Candidatus Dadabacteria bacterium]MXZ47918.1 hypothetical protein [Candidatus Dadabacteria bacterium]MYB26612.1 hypothetical protein [Candidatus Dadabacteria bacterium]